MKPVVFAILIVTDQINSFTKGDGTVGHRQVCALETGTAFPQPFEQWVKSPQEASPEGRYEVLSTDLEFKNGDFVLNRFNVLRRPMQSSARVVSPVEPAKKTA